MEKVTRRKFIVDGSILAGGTLATMALGGQLLTPKIVQAAKVEFYESSCTPEKQTGKKVLIAYASFCGSTGGVAETIGQVLCDHGASVDIRLVDNVEDLKPYDAVVIGSAIRNSSWWPEAIEFVKTNQDILRQIPVAYFATCLALYEDNESTRKIARSYIDPVLNAVPEIMPTDVELFAGALDYSKMNLIFRTVMKSKMKERGVPEGDFRDWVKIRAWSKGLCPSILG